MAHDETRPMRLRIAPEPPTSATFVASWSIWNKILQLTERSPISPHPVTFVALHQAALANAVLDGIRRACFSRRLNLEVTAGFGGPLSAPELAPKKSDKNP
jgi:hypothetical protein